MGNTGEERHFKLKSPLEIRAMLDNPNCTELVNYIDRLHNIIKDYQIVIDTAILKNIAVKS